MRSNEVDMPSIFKSWGGGGGIISFLFILSSPFIDEN